MCTVELKPVQSMMMKEALDVIQFRDGGLGLQAYPWPQPFVHVSDLTEGRVK